MTRVRTASPRSLRTILCFKFLENASFSDIAALKHELIQDERVLHSVDATGSFDFIAEAELPSLASHQELLDSLSARFDHVTEHLNASLICRRYLRESEVDPGHFWVPSARGLQRLDHERLEKVTVEGDYVRLHSGGQGWMLHLTLKKVLEQLDPEHFVQLNRSVIVRTDMVHRLIRQNRRWIARLGDGSEHCVAQSRSSKVVARLKSESDVLDHGSSENDADNAETAVIPETAML